MYHWKVMIEQVETVSKDQHLAENGAVLRNVTSKIQAGRGLYY